MVEDGDEREIGFGLILDHTLPLVTNALCHAMWMKFFCHPYMAFIPFVLFLPSFLPYLAYILNNINIFFNRK